MVLEDLFTKGKNFFRRGFVPLLASSALLFSCGSDDNKKPTEPVDDQPRVYELSNVELNTFSKIERDKVVFSEPRNYFPGDVIVGGISEKTPNGILFEVTGVSPDGTIVHTKPASLEQVLDTDTFVFNQPILSNGNNAPVTSSGKIVSVESEDFEHSYNFEGVILAENSPGGRLVLDGSLSFNLVPDIEAVWKDRYIKAQINLEQGVDLRLVSDLDFKINDFQKSYPLLNLAPIPLVGLVVLTPSIDIVVGVLSGLSTDLKANLFQRANLTPGLVYVNGNWKNITGFENQFGFSVDKVMSSLEVEVYAGPYIKFHINDYGLLLPAVQGGISGNIQFESELDNWSFWGGLAANIGVDPSRFFELFVSPYNKKVLEKKELLAEGGFGKNLSYTEGSVASGGVGGGRDNTIKPLVETCQRWCIQEKINSWCDFELKASETLSGTCNAFAKSILYSDVGVNDCSTIDCNNRPEEDWSCSGLGGVWEAPSITGECEEKGLAKRFIQEEATDSPPLEDQICCTEPILSDSQDNLIVVLPGNVNMDFIYVSSGRFLMGSPDSDEMANKIEMPQHEVTISEGFYLSKYEVTQKQWMGVMKKRVWDSGLNSQSFPAMSVTWEDAQDFIHELNLAEGDSLYRLPSEAEWEYACRAGTKTRWSFGDDENKLKDYAWYSSGPPRNIGTKLPNPWGFYDMHGNVREWVQDFFDGYIEDSQVDPQGPSTLGDSYTNRMCNTNNQCVNLPNLFRVQRSGCSFFNAEETRSANRSSGYQGLISVLPDNGRDVGTGFRIVKRK
ncbi:MAG: formylglycine-generating enzyme family protein [Nanoarchaeota archaeon]|nr:formylglycine-generating enzyme family protein [Nanoarchaeota archaeon]